MLAHPNTDLTLCGHEKRQKQAVKTHTDKKCFTTHHLLHCPHNTYSSLQERTVRQMFMCMLTELVWPMEFVVVMGLSASAKQLVKNCFT